MTPTDPKQRRDPASMETLVGSMQAVRVVMARLEQLTATAIWKANPANRGRVIACVMQAAKDYAATLERCEAPPKREDPAQVEEPGSGGVGPDCRPGYHEEYGICVPDV